MKPSPEIEKEAFSGGVRLWWPLTPEPQEPAVLTSLDWSWSRPALDRFGQLVRLIDLPDWQFPAAQEKSEMDWVEPVPVVAADARAARAAEFGELGIEIEGGTYGPAERGVAPRWEFSPGLHRLCGRVALARVDNPGPAAFHEYLLRLNRNLRFSRLGCLDNAVFLQVVLPDEDRAWLGLAQNALISVHDVLRTQAVWWCQPRGLVEDLFRQAGL